MAEKKDNKVLEQIESFDTGYSFKLENFEISILASLIKCNNKSNGPSKFSNLKL